MANYSEINKNIFTAIKSWPTVVHSDQHPLRCISQQLADKGQSPLSMGVGRLDEDMNAATEAAVPTSV